MGAKTRDESIEILRGWAIIGVLLIHTSMYFKYSNDINLLVVTNIIIDIISQAAVPLFFFISGYVLTLNDSPKVSYKEFYKKRFGSVLPQYILVSCFYLLYSNIFKLEIPSILSMVKLIILFDASFHLWFFKALFEFYLFYPIIRKIYDDAIVGSHYKLYLLFTVILQLLWTNSNSIPAKGLWLEMLLFGTTFLGWIVYFVLGMLACSYKKALIELVTENILKIITIMGILLVPISAAWIDLFFGEKHYIVSIGRMLLEPILFISVIMYLFAKSNTLYKFNSVFSNLLLYFGNYSFGIYLAHVFFMRIFVDFIAPNFKIPMFSGWFYIDLFFFMAVLSIAVVNISRKLLFHKFFISKLNRKYLLHNEPLRK